MGAGLGRDRDGAPPQEEVVLHDRPSPVVVVMAQVSLLLACMVIVAVVCGVIWRGRAEPWVGALLPMALAYIVWLAGGSRRDRWIARLVQVALPRR